MLKAALIGVGKWAHGGWFQTLLDGAGSSLLELSIVDVEASIPTHIAKDPRSHLVTYVSQQEQQSIPILDLAVIAVPARRHHECIQRILPRVRPGGSLVCEKPGGNSISEFEDMCDMCRCRNISFAISDHYIVRQTVQAILGRECGSACLFDNAQKVHAHMLETQATGPDQDVDLDMTVHMLNLIHILLPNSSFVPEMTAQSQATSASHVDVTYSISQGVIVIDGQEIPCQIDVGKQMREDRKEIIIETASETEVIDLSYAPGWRYDRIIRDISDGRSISCGTGHSGAVPPSIALRTWVSMTQARLQAQPLDAYVPGALPQPTAFKRWSDQS